MGITVSILYLLLISEIVYNNQVKKEADKVGPDKLEIQLIEETEVLEDSNIYNTIGDFHPLIQQEIALENGQVLNCQIPIFTHRNLQNVRKIVLSQQIGEYLLRHLQNQCCYMTSQFFLWEYCFMKYARQYDDEETMFNGNKKQPENYYLGYYQKYDKKKNQTEYKYRNSYYKVYKLRGISQLHRSVNPISDNIMIFNPRRMNLDTPSSYRMSLTIDFDQFNHLFNDHDLIDSINRLDYKLMKYSARTSDEIKISRKVLFIFGNLIVLDYGLPDRLSSRIELENDVEAEIVFYENKQGYLADMLDSRLNMKQTVDLIKNRKMSQNLGHNNKVYCSYQDCFYLQNYKVGQLVQITYQNKTMILNTQVIQIVSNDIMVLNNHFKTSNRIIMIDIISRSSIIDNHRDQQQTGKGSISIYGSVVFGHQSEFTDQLLSRHSSYSIKVISNNQIYLYQVEKVYDDRVLKIRNSRLYQQIHQSSKYMIVETKQYIYELPQMIELLHPQLTQKIQQNLDYHIYDGRQILQFMFNKDQQNHKFAIKLCFYDSIRPIKQVEVNFLDSYQVLVRYMNNKMNYKLSNRKIWQQNKQRSFKIWVLIDLDIIRVGIDSDISYQNQLVKFNYAGIQINRIKVDQYQTYNVEIYNMKIRQADHQVNTFLKNFDKIDDQQINQQIQTIKDHDLRFVYEIRNGTVCDNIGQQRQSKIELKCSQNGQLLEFESINEDEYCSYHIILGTSLLCQDEKNNLMNQDEFNKILCRV